jgi:hypothetical protein
MILSYIQEVFWLYVKWRQIIFLTRRYLKPLQMLFRVFGCQILWQTLSRGVLENPTRAPRGFKQKAPIESFRLVWYLSDLLFDDGLKVIWIKLRNCWWCSGLFFTSVFYYVKVGNKYILFCYNYELISSSVNFEL